MAWIDTKKKLQELGRASNNRRTKAAAGWLSHDDHGRLFTRTPNGQALVSRFLQQRRVDKALWGAVVSAAHACENGRLTHIFKAIQRLSKTLARDLTSGERTLIEQIREKVIRTLAAPSFTEEGKVKVIEKRTTPVGFPNLTTRAWSEMLAEARLAEELEKQRKDEEALDALETPEEPTDEELGLIPVKAEPLMDLEATGESVAEPDGEPMDPLGDFDFNLE